MKQKTSFVLAVMLCLAAPAGMAQKKDCKFLKGKNEKGKAVEMVAAPSKLGNFYLWKDDGKYFMSYSTKVGLLFFGSDESAKTRLGIDSVDFFFGDAKTTLPAKGYGEIKNEANKLKYSFEFVQFQVSLSEAMVARFTSEKFAGVYVRGEKEATWGDTVTEKHLEKLVAAFGCI